MAGVRAKSISTRMVFYDPRIENLDFGESRTLLGCDVALLDLAGLAYQYEQTYSGTYKGLPCLNDDDSFRFVRDAHRRRTEIESLLQLGKTVVVFVPPPERFFIYTGDDDYSGTGRNRQRIRKVEDVGVLSVLPFDLRTQAAASSDLRLVAGDPFATFWREVKDKFSAKASIQNDLGKKTLVIQGTDTAVGQIASVDNGLVVLIPSELSWEADQTEADWEERPPEYVDPEDAAFLDALFDLIAELRQDAGDYELPTWTKAARLPGEAAAEASLREAEERVAAALEARDLSQSDLEQLEQRKLLIAGTGNAFEKLAEQALEALGFSVEPGDRGRTDRIATRGDAVAVIEMKGKGKSAAEADAAQLEKWVAGYIEEHERTPKALLVVNAWRDKPLSQRTNPAFPDQMLPYSERREHCLVTGAQLLSAWLEVEADPEKADEIAASLMECVGRWHRYPEQGQGIEEIEVADDEQTDGEPGRST